MLKFYTSKFLGIIFPVLSLFPYESRKTFPLKEVHQLTISFLTSNPSSNEYFPLKDLFHPNFTSVRSELCPGNESHRVSLFIIISLQSSTRFLNKIYLVTDSFIQNHSNKSPFIYLTKLLAFRGNFEKRLSQDEKRQH